MSEITLIGIGLAKTVFRINALDGKGKRVMNKKIHRDGLVRFFAPLTGCTVAMEACCSESLRHQFVFAKGAYKQSADDPGSCWANE